MLSKSALLCLESNLYLKWELFTRTCVNNSPESRKLHSEYTLSKHLRSNPEQFFEYFNMSVQVYDYIYESVRERLDSVVITIKTISPAEKLFMTLRYLAKGITLRELSNKFLIGCSTASKVISETLAIIWEEMHLQHLRPPDPLDAKKLAEEYHHRWRFPNCIGAIGGKYIALNRNKKNRKTKLYWKRQLKKSSLVLHAVADAGFRFLAVDVTQVKSEPDHTFGGALSGLGWSIAPDSDINLPLVVIGNQAYPLRKYLLRPYPLRNNRNESKLNFNNRLEKARVPIDCAFEILSDKWQILQRPSEVHLEFAIMIVKVACLLNNIIKDVDGMKDQHFCKFGQKDYGVIYLDLLTSHSKKNSRATSVAIQIREQFGTYLMDHE